MKLSKTAIEFCNWLLSDERKALTSEQNQQNVTDADVANFALKLKEDKNRGAVL